MREKKTKRTIFLARFDTLEKLIHFVAKDLQPLERMTVSQCSEKYRHLRNIGSYVGPWRNDKAPYLVDIMNSFESPTKTAVIFVASAQCGKTESFLNWLNYVQLCDPSDMLFVQTTMKRAQNYSETNLERFKNANREYRNRMLPGRHNDGVLKKRFRSGTILNLSWPSITELSGRSVRRIFLTDYDRNEENIGGEGDCFQLAVRRTTSFKHRGMTVAESTPGAEVEDPRWEPSTKHEAPPAKKILALYNRGTRKRWYWKCTGCHTRFEPDFSLMKWEEKQDIPTSANSCYLECPKCEKKYYEGGVEGRDSKYLMNLSGKWLADGCSFDEDDNIIGEEPISDYDSYWLKGVCAAFSKWSKLVSEYLEAEQEYEKTGSEEALKTFYNTSLGEPYQYKADEIDRLPEHLKARAKDLGEKVVPKGVRFLVANIDVQKNMFVVQVHGYGVNEDVWIVDRFNVKKSDRLDEDGHPLWVKPGAYLEDWKLLIPKVLQKTYELDDGSERRMEIKAISCDSAGQTGVTANAYNFFRYLKNDYEEDRSLYRRFILTKGRSTVTGPRTQITYPDSDRKDRNAEGRGEIPVLMLNTHELKNIMNQRLDREESGGGRVNFPKWLPTWFYEEMCAERVEKGKWVPIAKRNEAWDLLVYSYGLAISPRFVAMERIDWDDPPEWAGDWDNNPLIVGKDGKKTFDKDGENVHTMEELADILS
jgi:phage terminase large subunit GpA-like protein